MKIADKKLKEILEQTTTEFRKKTGMEIAMFVFFKEQEDGFAITPTLRLRYYPFTQEIKESVAMALDKISATDGPTA